MTMDAMNKYLENEGFLVKRVYNRSRREYEFTLTKGIVTKKYYWKYPSNPNNLATYQIESMDRMIGDFKEQMRIDTAVNKVRTNSLYGSLETGYVYKPEFEPESLYPRLFSIQDYNKADIELTKHIERRMSSMGMVIPELNNRKLAIKDVIFNDPATIILWTDGTKTVVKAVNEPFDKEKGLSMAIAKKFFGNKGNYYNNLKKWLKDDE